MDRDSAGFARIFTGVGVAILAALLATSPVQGQSVRVRSLEANVGIGTGRGGVFDGRSGIGLDALLSATVGTVSRGQLVAAVGASAQLPVGGNDRCSLTPGGCAPPFPLLAPVAVLGGWETRNGIARVLAGPAYVYTQASSVRGATGGVAARLDLSTPTLARMALTLSARTLVVPAYRGNAIRHFAVGVGTRIR